MLEGPPARLEARTRPWAAGRPIIRAHPSRFGSNELDRRGDADNRWSPITVGGQVVGVLYAAESHRAAASETIFRTVPIPEGNREDRPRQVFLGPYQGWVWSTLACSRELTLVDLDTEGLAALGVTWENLIGSGRLHYPMTRRWAEALWRAAPSADGLVWRSRQAPDQEALVLFEKLPRRPGGLRREELFSDGPPDPFFYPQGLERLFALAAELDVTIVL